MGIVADVYTSSFYDYTYMVFISYQVKATIVIFG